MIEKKINKPITFQVMQVLKSKMDFFGLTQKELANRVGIDSANLCRMLQGKYSPSLDICIKLFREVGCSSIPFSHVVFDDLSEHEDSPLIPFDKDV